MPNLKFFSCSSDFTSKITLFEAVNAKTMQLVNITNRHFLQNALPYHISLFAQY